MAELSDYDISRMLRRLRRAGHEELASRIGVALSRGTRDMDRALEVIQQLLQINEQLRQEKRDE